ncbi:4c178de2-59db-4c17-b734-ab0b07163eac [Thermothielavioides terrestris]|uniref:Dicer-like protein 1 n=1 Tax=Thermothielavioides terrestris TaxID=2587410 RepID=A0A446BM91_9PEZI|nr:4c178de2-59db-4c17-b734-ab0b07163eac [Thermothielavioides terrestris]
MEVTGITSLRVPPACQPSPIDGDLMDLDEPAVFEPSGQSPTAAAGRDAAEEEDTDHADADADADEVEDGGEKLAVNAPRKRRKISERKRADNAAFDLWIEENQETLSRRPDRLVIDDDKSLQSLVRDFENKRIIASPRDYQLELFERAKAQNTIAVLDTGSGKTLIAALLLRWTIQNELENRSKGLPKRVAFFLVDKVALVFQQHAVLACNLDYPIEKFCGDMVDEVSSKEFWDKTFDENMAIVLTAEILYQCLHHSYIRMDQINLLVFDEAHHTKKNHPYARIIKDFYIEVKDEGKRPRIFGMTASPVDAQIDPVIAAAELEALLHSQIATVADTATLQHNTAKPEHEFLVEYERRPPDWETDLNRALKELVGCHRIFKKPFAFTDTAAAELGPWCADRYWQLFFREDNAVKLESRTERELLRESAYHQSMDEHIGKVKQAYQLVNQHRFPRPGLSPHLLSSKVILLVRILWDQFNGGDNNRRCIVFVRQRNVATLLVDLLQQPEMKIPGLKPGVLVGGGRPEASWDNEKVTYRDQVLTIIKFKKGELNCIFATSVAEEGLDIPDCNVIIRYDLNDTLIQLLSLNKQGEDVLRKFCEAMPEDRKLSANTFDMDYFLRKEKDQRQYTVPETGAKLNYKQSMACLATFVASLPHPPEVSLTADYLVLPVPGGFQCEVTLPESSPIRSVTGRVHLSKVVAKCSAAFEMCLLLIKGKYLDQHLRPVFTKQLPAMRNARLAVSSKKKEQYKMRIKPEIWSHLGEPTELHVMALTLADPAALGHASSPLLLLSRQPIPRVAPFALFFGLDRSSAVNCIPVLGTVKFDDDSLIQGLAAFTLTIFKDVFSKEYEATAAQLPYFLAPTRKDHHFDFGSVADPCHIIDWASVKFVQANEHIVCTFDEPDDFYKDKYVTDPFDGSRKFFLLGRCHGMKPTDPVPDGIVPPRHRAWRVTCRNHDILNYSLSAWSSSRGRIRLREDQPVVEAELLPIRRNLLDDNVGDEDLEPKPCFLVLEPLRISPLPVDVVAMAYNFPAIIHRIDSNLVALDACKMLGLDIRPDLALEAFTKDSDNTEEHDAEQVNFQGGMGNNYERLEFLGDCFLKMATTISIFTLIPDKAEFEYHVERMLLICNRNLFNKALNVKLEEYIRSMAFDRRSWYPEGLVLRKGKRKDITRQHMLADKTIADVCEALIGAAYLTAQEKDPNNFDIAVQAVTALVKDKNHTMTSYRDYYAAYVKPDWQTAPANSTQLDMAARFHARMGYAFKHPRLLRSAFQHPTYPFLYERLPSYQRLEFLGDALLDMASVEFLFHRFPGADPQWLTEHKMAMVSNQFLGCLAVELGFHRALTYCSPALQREIGEYVAEMEEALQSAREDAARHGRREDEYSRDYWVDCSRPPKCLPDTVEAYVGAVFVDSEYDFGRVRDFFARHVRPFFEDMRLYDTFASKHPVTFLAGVMQQRLRCGDWRLLTRELPPAIGGGEGHGAGAGAEAAAMDLMGTPQVVCAVRVHGQTLAHAVAASSRYAKTAAAKKALKVLEELDADEFRRRYGCACALDGEILEEEEGAHGTAI